MIGHIFNIQKFSLHDGPGIRTTVFFKGCNLRCSWCANPESQQMRAQLTLDREKCAGCGSCASLCPAKARALSGGFPAVDAGACTLCGHCLEACPTRAIGREGSEMTVEEVLAEVLKDEAFYRQSGGGVTFSGGEPLLQIEFATALARALHESGVSVAIETAAAIPGERFRAFLREIDYVHIDLKHYDSARHRAGTGLGNEQILENIFAVRDSGLPYLVRIPVIPGFNASPEDAQGFAKLLASLRVDRVQLLPFHQLGERKYSLLGRAYAHAGQAQLHKEDLKQYRQIMLRHGLDAQL